MWARHQALEVKQELETIDLVQPLHSLRREQLTGEELALSPQISPYVTDHGFEVCLLLNFFLGVRDPSVRSLILQLGHAV